jgi:PAS domain S-box-containing protein
MGDEALKSNDHRTEWVELYHAALLEVDYERLPERIKLAEDAIGARLQILAASGSRHETSDIQDARQNLRVLQREMETHRSSTTEHVRHLHPEIDGDFVVFVNANRRYIEVTDGVCRLLGYSREELLAKTIDDIAAPELRAQVSETFGKYVRQGEMEGNYSLLAKDGSPIPIRYQSKVYPDGCYVARWKPIDQGPQNQSADQRKDQAS